MKVVLQRVKEASLAVKGEKRASANIEKGYVLLVGIAREDTSETIRKMAKKVAGLRIFEDENGKMNLDLAKVNGKILSVPQFTLLADTTKGQRPGFDGAKEPESAERLWREFNNTLKGCGITVEEGVFGAHMEVGLTNDGPVTLVLEVRKNEAVQGN